MASSEEPLTQTDPRLLLLSPSDNVYVLTQTIDTGESVLLNGSAVTFNHRLPLGHKIAARDIAAGEKIIKYGAVIGTAIQSIRAGEHVHTHNLKSDYLPTVSA